MYIVPINSIMNIRTPPTFNIFFPLFSPINMFNSKMVNTIEMVAISSVLPIDTATSNTITIAMIQSIVLVKITLLITNLSTNNMAKINATSYTSLLAILLIDVKSVISEIFITTLISGIIAIKNPTM